MLNFHLTEDHRLLEQSVREWGAREVSPKIRDLDRAHKFDKALIIGGMKQLGLLGISVPQQYGGGAPTIEEAAAQYAEERRLRALRKAEKRQD